MKNQLELEVKNPCLEKFNNFKPTRNGGHCNTCSQEVIDFTKMKDEKIIKFFKNDVQNTCGIFNNHQLKTYNQNGNKKSYFSFIGKIGIACITLLSFGNIDAQNTINKNDTTSVSQKTETFNVKGTVKENGLTLPGVNIILQGTSIGTSTDFDGNFVFPRKLKKGDVLIFSYIGYKSQKVVITDQKAASNVALKLDMELDEVMILGKVSARKIYKSRH